MPRGRWCEAPAAAVRGGPGARQCIGTRSHHPPSRHGWRAARGRPAGAASAAARLSDAPAWTRRWAAEAPVSLVAVRGAAQPAPTYWRGGSPLPGRRTSRTHRRSSPASQSAPRTRGRRHLSGRRSGGRTIGLWRRRPLPPPQGGAEPRPAWAAGTGRVLVRGWRACSHACGTGSRRPRPSRGGRPELTTMRLGGGRAYRLAPHIPGSPVGTGVPQFP